MIDWKLRVGDIRKLGFVPWAKQNWKQLLGWIVGVWIVLAVVVHLLTPAPKTYHTENRYNPNLVNQWGRKGGYEPVQVEDTPEYKRQHSNEGYSGRSSARLGNTGNTTVDQALNHFQQNWGSDLIALLFGIALGWFLLRWIILAIVALVVLALLATGFWPFYLVAGFIIGVNIAMILRQLARRRGGGKKKKNTEFGTAEWATLEHLQANNLIGRTGFPLGFFQLNGVQHPIHYTGDRHLLTVAPTRAGKGTTAIIPTLLRHAGSALVIDPKGENARVTAKQRMAMGQRVYVVDPWGITGMPTAQLNPLDWLDPNDPDVAENAFMLADALIVRSSNSNPFFEEAALSMLWGFILYVALDPAFAGPHRNLGTVRDLLSLGAGRLGPMLMKMYQHPNPIVRGTAERTASMDLKTRANVMSNLQSQTLVLDSPRIRQSLAASSFRFEDLKAGQDGKPVTVYLVLPADRLNTYGRWLRLLIQQAITCNARNLGQKPAGGRPILFMLDEMAALGKLTKVEEAYGLMAGFGMQLWGIVQDLAQLDRIYDKGWETFIGNSGVLQYFGSRDEKTASYFSKLVGVSTIEKFSITRSISRTLGISRSSSSSEGGFSSSTSSSDSTTTGTSEASDVIQRPLAFPDELMRMSAEKSLVLIETFNPIDARKVPWFKDPELAKVGENIQGRPIPVPLVQPAVVLPPLDIPGVPKGAAAAMTPPPENPVGAATTPPPKKPAAAATATPPPPPPPSNPATSVATTPPPENPPATE